MHAGKQYKVAFRKGKYGYIGAVVRQPDGSAEPVFMFVDKFAAHTLVEGEHYANGDVMTCLHVERHTNGKLGSTYTMRTHRGEVVKTRSTSWLQRLN